MAREALGAIGNVCFIDPDCLLEVDFTSMRAVVRLDQSRFVLGRCIIESFAYAADLLHCCYRRDSPTIILKLDFHKAFDCVNWSSLAHILR